MDRLSRSNSRESLSEEQGSLKNDSKNETSSKESSEEKKQQKDGDRDGTGSMSPTKPTMKSESTADKSDVVSSNSYTSSSGAIQNKVIVKTGIKLNLNKLSTGQASESSSNPVVSPRIGMATHRTQLAATSPLVSPTTTVAATTTASLTNASSTKTTVAATTTASVTNASSTTTTPSIVIPKTVKGVAAEKLTGKSRSILQAAMMQGKISPEALGYVLVDVQTVGFTKPLNKEEKGMAFLRGGLVVNGITNSNGDIYEPINLINRFLEPEAEAAFNTQEWTKLRDRLISSYLPVSKNVELIANGMKPSQMQESDKLKRILDPIIQPLVDQVCGADRTFAGSGLPDYWKRLLRGVDDAVIHWGKKTNCTDHKELNQFRKEGLIVFLSTRGMMIVWGLQMQELFNKKETESRKFLSYMNSYFSQRTEDFLTDIMLTRKVKEGDEYEIKTSNYLRVLSGGKKLKTDARMDNSAASNQLKNPKILKSTKSSMGKMIDNSKTSSTVLSPRAKQRIDSENIRLNTKQKNEMQRQEFFKIFNKKVIDLFKLNPEYYRYMHNYVVQNMSEQAYEKFKEDPVKYCLKHLDKFYSEKKLKEKDDDAIKKTILEKLQSVDPEKIKDLKKTLKEKSSTDTTSSTSTSSTSTSSTSTSSTSTSSTTAPSSSSISYPPFSTEDDISDEKNE